MLRLLAVWAGLLIPASAVLIALAVLVGRVLPDSGKIVFAMSTPIGGLYHLADADNAVYINLSRRYSPVSIPWLAPDGQHIAWVSAGTVTSEIRVADMLSHTVRAFPQPFEVYGLIWSHDSRKLAFEAVSDIYLLDIESGQTRPLIDHPSGDWYPVWSPDDRSIAFISERDVGNWQIYTVDVDTRQLTLLPCPDIPCTTPDWSPDGRYLTFDANSVLYSMRLDGTELQPFTDGKSSDPGWGPQWSSDGTSILFTASPSTTGRDIYSYDWLQNQRHRLTHHPNLDQGPLWSPDGKQIAFISDRDVQFSIYIMDADGSHLRRFMSGSFSLVIWRP